MEEEDDNRYWTISFGLYPGILLGIRSYDYEDCTMHVLYLPFIDLSLEISK